MIGLRLPFFFGSLLQVMMNSLWFDKDLQNATDTPRIHHQLTPNEIFVEPGVLQVRPSRRLSVCRTAPDLIDKLLSECVGV